MTHSRIIVDTLRGIRYKSIKEAWECYCPQMKYSQFYYKLRTGKIPNLYVSEVKNKYKEDPKCITRSKVIDAESQTSWSSVSDCAKDLRVSRQAVQLAIKRGNKCHGHTLKFDN